MAQVWVIIAGSLSDREIDDLNSLPRHTTPMELAEDTRTSTRNGREGSCSAHLDHEEDVGEDRAEDVDPDERLDPVLVDRPRADQLTYLNTRPTKGR